MSVKNIIVPDIGDFDEVEIIEVLVSVGDRIEAEDSLITVSYTHLTLPTTPYV